jgi:hypothetical protein
MDDMDDPWGTSMTTMTTTERPHDFHWAIRTTVSGTKRAKVLMPRARRQNLQDMAKWKRSRVFWCTLVYPQILMVWKLDYFSKSILKSAMTWGKQPIIGRSR